MYCEPIDHLAGCLENRKKSAALASGVSRGTLCVECSIEIQYLRAAIGSRVNWFAVYLTKYLIYLMIVSTDSLVFKCSR